MKRFAGLFVVAAWLAAVTWYWRENVPLVPTKTVEIPPDRVSPTYIQSDQLILHTRRFWQSNFLHKNYGPVEFWDFPACQKVRELFTAEDEVVTAPKPTGEILIRRRGALELYDSNSGNQLLSLPDIPSSISFLVVPNRRQVLLQSRSGVQLFDYGDTTPRWTANSPSLGRGPVTGIFIGGVEAPGSLPGSTRIQPTAFRMETGERDPLFDHISGINDILLSADGRLALINTGQGVQQICDAVTGKMLWSPGPAPVSASFSRDGSEVRTYDFSLRGSKYPGCRWRADNGQLLSRLTESEWRAGSLNVTANGRYATISAESFFGVGRLLSPVPIPASWKAEIEKRLRRSRHGVIDQRTGGLVGYFPDGCRPIILSDNRGFATYRPGQVAYYAFPLRLNYFWLAGRALLLPAVLILLLHVPRHFRSRKKCRGTRPERTSLASTENVQL